MRRGHTYKKVIRIENKIIRIQRKPKIKQNTRGRYLGKVTMDNTSKIHKHIMDLINLCNLPDHIEKPRVIGGKKMISFAFTRKSMMEKLKKLV